MSNGFTVCLFVFMVQQAKYIHISRTVGDSRPLVGVTIPAKRCFSTERYFRKSHLIPRLLIGCRFNLYFCTLGSFEVVGAPLIAYLFYIDARSSCDDEFSKPSSCSITQDVGNTPAPEVKQCER